MKIHPLDERNFSLHVSPLHKTFHRGRIFMEIGSEKGLNSKISHDDIRSLFSPKQFGSQMFDNQISMHVNAIKSTNETTN